MSLLTPERVPVKVYRWDDEGAPALDKTPNCMMTIFKACLVTGYGTKDNAGWTMPWEDTAAGVKVFQPQSDPRADLYLRVSTDTGTDMMAQVYLNMTDINAGDLKLQSHTPFKYGKSNTSPRWMLVASPIGFWFFSEQSRTTDLATSGAYFCLTHAKSTHDIVPFLQHSAGTNNDGNYSPMTGVYTGTDTYMSGQLLNSNSAMSTAHPRSITNGTADISRSGSVAPLWVDVDERLYIIVGMYVPLTYVLYKNYDSLMFMIESGATSATIHGAAGWGRSAFAVATDAWEY